MSFLGGHTSSFRDGAHRVLPATQSTVSTPGGQRQTALVSVTTRQGRSCTNLCSFLLSNSSACHLSFTIPAARWWGRETPSSPPAGTLVYCPEKGRRLLVRSGEEFSPTNTLGSFSGASRGGGGVRSPALRAPGQQGSQHRTGVVIGVSLLQLNLGVPCLSWVCWPTELFLR